MCVACASAGTDAGRGKGMPQYTMGSGCQTGKVTELVLELEHVPTQHTAQLWKEKAGPTIDFSKTRVTCKCFHFVCVFTCLQKEAKVLDCKGNRLRKEDEKKETTNGRKNGQQAKQCD